MDERRFARLSARAKLGTARRVSAKRFTPELD
jgi:hypothetical protein